MCCNEEFGYDILKICWNKFCVPRGDIKCVTLYMYVSKD